MKQLILRRIVAVFVVFSLAIGGFFVLKFKTDLLLLPYKYKSIQTVFIDGVEFPKEEARNGGAEKIEWWYIPLYLSDKADSSRKFNVMITFHKNGPGPQVFIINIKDQKKYFATINEQKTNVLSSEKLFLRNGKNFLIETDLFKYRVYCREDSLRGYLGPDAVSEINRESSFVIDLKLASLKNPIFLRQNEKKENTDIIQSKVSVSGSLSLDRKKYKIDGFGWIYHQSPSQVSAEIVAGWNWLAIQLDNNRELVLGEGFFKGERNNLGVLYLFNEDSSGSVFKKLKKEEFILEELDTLENKEFNRNYLTTWSLSVPSENIDIKIDAILKNQIVEIENNSSYEGICGVSGTWDDKKVGGWAYSEQVLLPSSN